MYKGSRKPHVFEASHTRNRGSLRDRIGQGNGAEDMQDTREELAEMETTRRPEDNFVFNFFQHYRYPERVVFWQDGGEEESAQERTSEEKRAHANEYGRTKNPRTHARTRLTAECYILGQSERRIYISIIQTFREYIGIIRKGTEFIYGGFFFLFPLLSFQGSGEGSSVVIVIVVVFLVCWG